MSNFDKTQNYSYSRREKGAKHYHFDWSLVSEASRRFENLVACHLLKWTQFQQDTKGRAMELKYFRDVDRREVDFVITENRKPLTFVECKWKDELLHPALSNLKKKFPHADAFQISANGQKEYVTPDGIQVCNAIQFLKTLI